MWYFIGASIVDAVSVVGEALNKLFIPGIFFIILALLVKGRTALIAGQRATRETCINLMIIVLDALLIAPPLALLLILMRNFLDFTGRPFSPDTWVAFHPFVVCLLAIFVGDFIGYWRHRLEHTRWLWPSHALHHSDTEMTWLAGYRFHPINRFSTVLVDTLLLSLFGFPPYALVINSLVRHYYGQFIHADLPWTFGIFQYIFVSPAMHRWHHADLPIAFGTNFATVFSVFDRAFGTYRVPGACNAPLGVKELAEAGLSKQLIHPLRLDSYRRDATTSQPEPDAVRMTTNPPVP
jgi:sterol desaturase/sphingolipid hydroxylase (fatty acid hydroxylase superfamily)